MASVQNRLRVTSHVINGVPCVYIAQGDTFVVLRWEMAITTSWLE